MFFSSNIRNMDVIVFEEHKKIGFPEHCAGIISLRTLQNFGFSIHDDVVENYYRVFRFRSLKKVFADLEWRRPVAVKINRPVFEEVLYHKTLDTGHRVILGSRVNGITIRDSIVVTSNGKYHYRVLLIATGSRGLPGVERTLHDKVWSVPGLQAVVNTMSRVAEEVVEIFLDPGLSNDMFAWIAPIDSRRLLIGVASSNASLYEKLGILSKYVDKAYGVKSVGKIFGGLILRGPPTHPFINPEARVYGLGDYIATSKSYTGGGLYAISVIGRLLASLVDGRLRNSDGLAKINEVLRELYTQYLVTRLVFKNKYFLAIQQLLLMLTGMTRLNNIIALNIDFDKHIEGIKTLLLHRLSSRNTSTRAMNK